MKILKFLILFLAIFFLFSTIALAYTWQYVGNVATIEGDFYNEPFTCGDQLTHWGLYCDTGTEEYGYIESPECYSSSTQYGTFTLPYGFCELFAIACYDENSTDCSDGDTFAFNDVWNDEMKNINVPYPSAGFLTLPNNFIEVLFAYTTELFNDIWSLVALIIGLPLAFWVILKIIRLI